MANSLPIPPRSRQSKLPHPSEPVCASQKSAALKPVDPPQKLLAASGCEHSSATGRRNGKAEGAEVRGNGFLRTANQTSWRVVKELFHAAQFLMARKSSLPQRGCTGSPRVVTQDRTQENRPPSSQPFGQRREGFPQGVSQGSAPSPPQNAQGKRHINRGGEGAETWWLPCERDP